MIGTYAAAAAVCLAALAIGQAALLLCGWRRWSWLAPAVGLAVLCAVCWGTVRLPGSGAASAVAVLLLFLVSLAILRRRLEGGLGALWEGAPVGVIALAAGSLPFAVEGHFGILGTSFNPDMSQHLLATARLADGASSPLLHQGYPLGPHAIVVALDKGLGIGLVQGFDGLSLAVAVLACLTALGPFRRLPTLPRTAAPLLVGLAYVVASYYAQGAFKETMQALFFLAFVLVLREASGASRGLPLRFLPAALIAAGSVYTYSFPGLIWLAGSAAAWALAEAGARLRRRPEGDAGRGPGPAPLRAALVALAAFVVLVGPEVGRMVAFRSFETFEPHGPGLGNLFGQISPFEALGIWPSGDFRLAPGDGAVPAPAYYLAIAFGLVLLAHGVVRCWRRRESAILSGLAVAALAYAAARAAGTPYTAAKAIEIAAPLCALTILVALMPGAARWRRAGPAAGKRAPLAAALALAFCAAAGLCSLLSLANAPIGPTSYSPALTEMRPLLSRGSTLVLASHRLISEQHGEPFIAWELRGGRVCVAARGEASAPPPGVRFVVAEGRPRQPFPHLRLLRRAAPYTLWEVSGRVRGRSPCPLVAVRQARQGPAR